MIVNPTVFVLGAGASEPYGFPVGSKLAQRVCDLMPRGIGAREDERDLNELREWELTPNGYDFSKKLAAQLPVDFRESGCDTLDEFVQPPGNRKFLPLVKAGIAKILTSCENDNTLFPQAPSQPQPLFRIQNNQVLHQQIYEDGDWMRYLFKTMRADSPEKFQQNQVKVVTFNFDRSFERKLYLMLQASYGLAQQNTVKLARAIPILHMHGRLGVEHWLDPTGRLYGPSSTIREFQTIYNDIRIVHEEIPVERTEECRDWMDSAHTIVLLGFGCHPSNVRRLTLDQQRREKKNVFGTAYGLTSPEARRAQNLFAPNFRPTLEVGKKCLQLLREEYRVLQTELN